MNDEVDMGAVERMASTWLVRLDDDPEDAGLRAEFEQWLDASPEHRRVWAETRDLDLLLEAARPVDAVALPAGNVVPLKLRRKARGKWRVFVPLAAAACLGLVLAADIPVWMQAQDIARTGEVHKVALQDGSTAWLAPGAAMAFSIDAEGRRLKLLRGKGYFDVAHDPAHPFRVEAGDGEVKVLGTAFEAGFNEQGMAVSVRRGLVEVSYPKGRVRDRLRPGQSIAVPWAGSPSRGQVRPDRIAAWMNGRLLVNDRPVRDVLEGLRPWYGGYIVARGPGLDTRRVTGIYDLRHPDAALEALARAHTIAVRDITPWLRIVTVE
ncbi:FecR family protein [Novosphingobium lindaniclasticum]